MLILGGGIFAYNADKPKSGTTSVPSTVPVDKSSLSKKVDEASQRQDEGDLTDRAWANYQREVQAAQNVFDSTAATQTEVDTITVELNGYILGLKDTFDPSRYEVIDSSAFMAHPDDYLEKTIALRGKVLQAPDFEQTAPFTIISLSLDMTGTCAIVVEQLPIDWEQGSLHEGDVITVYGVGRQEDKFGEDMPEDTYGGIDLLPAISYPFIADRYAVMG